MLALEGSSQKQMAVTHFLEFLLCAMPSVRDFIDRAPFNHNKNYRKQVK